MLRLRAMNPYDVSAATHDPRAAAASADSDIEALSLTPSARLSAGPAFSCGLLAVVLGAQGLSVFVANGLVYLYMGGSVACGVVLVFGASRLRRMRLLGAMLVAGAAGGIILLNALWSVVVSLAWLFTPLPMAQVALAMIAAIFGIRSLGPTRRADAARARLATSGLDIGV